MVRPYSLLRPGPQKCPYALRIPDGYVYNWLTNLIFAGHETTAHALTWAWYLLAKNPGKRGMPMDVRFFEAAYADSRG